MGFGVSFIRWVRLLYTDVRSSVLIIGYCFRAFRPSREVRQSCPLSPLLYILPFEVLAANIRCNPAISGLRLPGISSPLPVLSLHADDTSVISCSDRATKVLFEVYHRFEKGTRAKLNIGKCEGVWLGAWRGKVDKPIPIQWLQIKVTFWGFTLAMTTLRRRTGNPGLTRRKSVSIDDAGEHFNVVVFQGPDMFTEFRRVPIKISYSCMNNTKQIIDNHNKRNLNVSKHTDKSTDNSVDNKSCNCRQKKLMPS